MELVNLLPLKSLLTKDVELGTGKTENVLPALITGSSIIMEFVYQFLINVKLSIDQEPVFHAMKDITWLMELANLLQLRSLQILVVELGIGRTENALPAQTTGFSITMEFVYQFLINVKLSTDQEPVFHATKDIILRMELVNLPPLNILVMQVAVFGTGITENA